MISCAHLDPHTPAASEAKAKGHGIMAGEQEGTQPTGNGPPDDSGEWVRREHLVRVTNERDTARQELSTAKPQLEATAAIDDLYGAFRSMEGFQGDPYAAAKAAARDGIRKDPDHAEGFTDAVKGWWDTQRSSLGIPDATPPAQQQTTTEVNAAPPGSRGPDPSAGGGTPPPDRLKWLDPQVQDLVKRNDMAGIHKLIDEGRLELTPGNPAARKMPVNK